MAITEKPSIPSPLKIISISSKLVAVSVDESVPVPDHGKELEKLVESIDRDLDEVICLGILCSVMITETFLSAGISIADIFTNNPVHPIDLGTLHDDETVVARSKIKICHLNKVDAAILYDDTP